MVTVMGSREKEPYWAVPAVTEAEWTSLTSRSVKVTAPEAMRLLPEDEERN